MRVLDPIHRLEWRNERHRRRASADADAFPLTGPFRRDREMAGARHANNRPLSRVDSAHSGVRNRVKKYAVRKRFFSWRDTGQNLVFRTFWEGEGCREEYCCPHDHGV